MSTSPAAAQGLPKLLWEAGPGSPTTSLTALRLLLDAGRTAAVGSPLAAALGNLQVIMEFSAQWRGERWLALFSKTDSCEAWLPCIAMTYSLTKQIQPHPWKR